MVTILMMSAKISTSGLLKIKVFWNKGYDVIISAHDVTSKILSRDSNYIVDLVMWSGLIITLSSFKLKNLGQALDANLKFYTIVATGLKLNILGG